MKIMKIGFAIVAIASLFYGSALRARVQPSNTPVERVAHMQREYAAVNETYFNGSLPENIIITYEKDPDGDVDAMGSTSCDGDICVINIVPSWNPAETTMDETLIHEMVHVSFRHPKDENEKIENATHGPAFQKRMKELADEGAFNGIW